jgi:predicted ArsR family transcriptional regulator
MNSLPKGFAMAHPTRKAGNTHPSFLTNHAYVLLMIAIDNTVTMRDLALKIGITERAIQRIVEDLTSYGYLSITKEGRRNVYRLNAEASFPTPLMEELRVSDLLDLRRESSSAAIVPVDWKIKEAKC